MYLAFALAFLFMVVLPTIFVFALKNKPNILKPIISVMFAIYLCLLFVGTMTWFGKSGDTITLTFDFSTVSWFSSYFLWGSFGKLNILINISMFFPIGFVVFTFAKKHPFLKTILLAFGISLAIELLQFILPIYRNTEIFDLFLNTMSGLISATYCLIIQKLSHYAIFKHEKTTD